MENKKRVEFLTRERGIGKLADILWTIARYDIEFESEKIGDRKYSITMVIEKPNCFRDIETLIEYDNPFNLQEVIDKAVNVLKCYIKAELNAIH